MVYTRTHTKFFNDDDVQMLREECTRLTEDAADRMSHIDRELRERMENRLSNLRIAIELLMEDAD